MGIAELIKEFQNLGCANETTCAIAASVFMDLKDIKEYQTVEYHYEKDLNIIYMKNVNDEGQIEIFLPAGSTTPINFEEMQEIQDKLQNEDKTHKFLLAICDPSSTVLYYRLSTGID